MPKLSELTDYEPVIPVAQQERIYVSPNIPTSDSGDYFSKPVAPMPELKSDNVIERIIKKLAETEFSIVRFKGDKEKASQVYQNTRSIKAEDIAETIYWVATRPKNININKIEIMAGDQAFNPFNIVKNG